ncbi:hypothetical protein ATO49_17885 [Mycolicibacterium fortuitum subsp. fortuitum DSM 46621 = ATCC 6841 = JCM 6387]|nr:hypothetical protein ATO49_17885 [Mycolicibacterium fortuitum subsp. fortuitum DSM 46621 = ATCC 6841 = JCM 6387]
MNELDHAVAGLAALWEKRQECRESVELTGPQLEGARSPSLGQYLMHAFGIATQRLRFGRDDQARRKIGEHSVDR